MEGPYTALTCGYQAGAGPYRAVVVASVKACVEVSVQIGGAQGSTMYAKSAFTRLIDRLP